MNYTLSLFILLVLLLTPEPSFAALTPAAEAPVRHLDRAHVEQQLGRKLKFKERIGLSIIRGKAKRQARRAAKTAAGGSPVDGYAVASLVCGILGFFTFFTAIPALVLGIIALGRFNRDPQYRSGKGMAIAGVILGGLVLFAVLLIIGILAATWGRQ
ncbi:DUF4190 domain-containing protein [Neolewinella agarilytica]|uniref:DUF4190 domain-containing protein n=1 Tax=Neolewinella agarilytica TaxID=478744 RepID=A0A1H9KNI9_9BACT|nr:DUF4190 domain-containing protein [Neolewinella agarilytica]SER00505.1 protein of unknown function [Neolewinella agarilytica]